ncbi:hypothetical protein E2542_SST10011 [Spatholobus suberectus]|nr:hypothetical protein E2542_SST10011 [Spatholobus suberectus]
MLQLKLFEKEGRKEEEVKATQQIREATKPKRRERSCATPENDHRRARRCLVLLPCRIPSLSPISYGHLTGVALPRETRSRSHKSRPHRYANLNAAAYSELRPTNDNPFACTSPAITVSPFFPSRSLTSPPSAFSCEIKLYCEGHLI